jgi:hypothetical protein
MSMPPEPPTIILPTGQTGYLNPYKGTYTTSRSYALRMQRSFSRGISQSEARGHRAVGGLTESQWRRLRRLYVNDINNMAWENGPSRMNIIGGHRQDPRIFKQDVAAIQNLYDQGYRDPGAPSIDNWLAYAEWRLQARLSAMIDYQEYGDPIPGRAAFFGHSTIWPKSGIWLQASFDFASAPPIEFWYYH